MKKKILFVIDSLNSGGAEKSLISLLSLLDYERYDVNLLLFKKEGLFLPLVNENVRIIEVPKIFEDMKESIINLMKKRNFKEAIWRINTSINIRYKSKFTNIKHGAQLIWNSLDNVIPNLEDEYDVAIAYSQGTPTYYVSEKVKAKKKICWVNIDYRKAGYNKNFDLNYYYNFQNIITVSEKCTNVFKETFPEFKNKIITIYDIISEDLVKKMAYKNKGFNDSYKGVKILTIGRLVYQKGYEYAIEAAKYLKNKNIDFKWYVIGEGELEGKLKELVKNNKLEDNFKFLGTFTNPYPFINECDIYCQPSRFEGFGLAIAEARMLNKPIVATNFEIVHDQIRDRENGLIVDMNGESVANGILELINNNELTNSIISCLNKEKKGNIEELDKFYNSISE